MWSGIRFWVYKIDPGRFDPVAAKILSLIPPPQNSAVTLNYNGAYNGSRVTTIPGVKVDQIVGKAKISFYASFTGEANSRN